MNDLESRLRLLRAAPPLSPPPWEGAQVGSAPRSRRGLGLGLAAACFLVVLTLVLIAPPRVSPVEGPAGPLAGKSEEPPLPVRGTDLRRLGTWRNLPFEISAGEEEAVRRCLQLAAKANHTIDGVNQFALPVVREELMLQLSTHPGLFYAEHLLGLWFELNGRTAEAGMFRQRALEHAPVVLVQTFVHPNGRPVVGLEAGWIRVECNRVKNHEMLESVDLGFPRLRTNERGQMVVPAYDTIYRWDGNPTGRGPAPKGLGWFESPGKVGLLPTVVYRDDRD